MKLSINEFAELPGVADVTIHSLDVALYQVTVALQTGPHVLVDKHGKVIRHRNLQHVREMLHVLPVRNVVLRQESAFDEMIGQPSREGSNALEVQVSLEPYTKPITQ